MDLIKEGENTVPPKKSEKRSSPALLLDQTSPEPKKSFKSVKMSDGDRQIIEQELPEKSNKVELPAMDAGDFKELRNNGFVVDKTLFIREFLNCTSKVIAALFPRRFGKSTNLNMMKTFFEMELDENGKEREDEDKSNPYYFLGKEIKNGTTKLEALKISQYKDIIENNMGKFPTIYLDLKAAKDGNDFESMRAALNLCILRAYSVHQYLETSTKLHERDKTKFKAIIDSSEIPKKYIPTSLQFLSECLFTHWKKEVFVFIDEYDAPMNYVFRNEEFEQSDINNVIRMFSGVFTNLLKTNVSLKKALITGILHIHEAGFLSELNNILNLDCEYPSFANSFYGFTKDEVKILLERAKLDQKFMGQIQDWYNGYLFENVEIYNPFAVNKCITNLYRTKGNVDLEKESFKNYWADSGSLESLVNLFQYSDIQKIIKSLLNEKEVDYHPVKITKSNYQELIKEAKKKLVNFKDTTTKNVTQCELFYKILFQSGYFTLTSKKKLKIPNREIREEFISRLTYYFKQTYYINFEPCTKCLSQIFEPENHNMEECEKILKQFCFEFNQVLKDCHEFHDIKNDNSESGIHPNEDFVHSLLNVVCLNITPRIHFGTEILGVARQRCDILMTSKSNNIAVIIEVKYAKSASEALNQIIDKKYIKTLPANVSLGKRIFIGLNISKKKQSEFKIQMET